MERNSNKSNESSFSTTGTPASHHYSDNVENVKYINFNFVANSESSSQPKDVILEYQKFQNSFDQHPNITTQAQPNKILPGTISLPGLELSKTNKDPPLKEKSLMEMGFKANEVEGWENIVQPSKENLYKLLKNMIDNHIKPNVQIRIGSVNFNCHMMVLQCYSDFFMECNNEVIIQLPEEKITPSAFMMVYDWMLAEKPLIQREGILELFNAANFLRIKELINQCWLCLDDDMRFREDTAFLLYMEARNYGLESLEQLMLMRICKFFLTLVSSKEFVSLNAKEICTLLSSNTIGVNSEIEIFMSVVRWLSHNWEEREQHMLDVIKCVRFSLMPPWFLVTLSKSTDCFNIDRIVSHEEVKKMIHDGSSYTTTQLYYGENREEFLHFLERYKLVAPMQRQWIFDKECRYHHRLKCPNMQYITYKSFLEYLEMIQTIGRDYWRSLEMAKSEEKFMQCCKLDDCRKSMDPNLVKICTKQSRDQGIQCENYCKVRRGWDNSKINLTHNMNRSSKHSMLKTPRGQPKYVPSSSASTAVVTTNSINNDCNTTEAETTVDFKYPKEADVSKQQQQQQKQPENILYDYNNNHQQQTEVKVQNLTNSHSVHNKTPQPHGNMDKVKYNQQQQHHRKQLLKSCQIKPKHRQHYKQQLKYNKTTNSSANCTVIYKRDDDIMDAISNSDTNTIGGLHHHHHHQLEWQPHQEKCVIADNHVGVDDDDDDVELFKKINIDLVITNRVDGNFNEDLLKSRTITKQFPTAAVNLKRIPNHKILVFGGIDPYCLHCQHVQQPQLYWKQHQQQQHHHLQQQERKRVLSIDTIMNTQHTRSQHHHRPHPHSHTPDDTTTTINVFSNKKFENFGDHVLLYDADAVEWRHLSHLPFGSRHHHAVVVCNGLIYVIGGTRTTFGCTKKSVFEKSVWCFNPQTLKWTLESSLPESRKDFGVIAIEEAKCNRCNGTKSKQKIHDSGFYVIGGEGINRSPLSSVWFYNVKRKIWKKKPSLNIGRYGLAAAMVNNEIWVAGGIINDNSAGNCGNHNNNDGKSLESTIAHVITDTIEIYNLKCEHEILANNKVTDDNVEGFINVTGGGGGDGAEDDWETLARVEKEFAALGGIFNKNCDCNVGQWIKSNLHLRLPRVFGKFCKMSNGHLYLVGGIGLNDNGNFTSLTDIDKYNLEHNKWEHFGDLNWARHGHDVGTHNDHCLVVIGGVSTIEKQTLNKVEAFCTQTRKSLKDLMPDLPWPMSGCAVVTLN